MRRLTPWGFIGMGGLACDLFLYVGSETFMPWWMTLALCLAWIPMLVIAARWFEPKPRWTLWMAVFGAVLWFVAVTITGVID